METKEMITIPLARWEELLEMERWLESLEAAGVDNWDGIDYAQEIFNNG